MQTYATYQEALAAAKAMATGIIVSEDFEVIAAAELCPSETKSGGIYIPRIIIVPRTK